MFETQEKISTNRIAKYFFSDNNSGENCGEVNSQIFPRTEKNVISNTKKNAVFESPEFPKITLKTSDKKLTNKGIKRNCFGYGSTEIFQNRWYDPKTGQFLSPDPVDIDINNPFTFNKYAFCNNNPWKYSDPTGEKTYLIFVGGEFNNRFVDFQGIAESQKSEIMTRDDFNNDGTDQVQIISAAIEPAIWIDAFDKYKDISEVYYYGHGGKGHLFLGGKSGQNLTEDGGENFIYGLFKNKKYSSTSVKLLSTKNMLKDAKIYLYSCHSGQGWIMQTLEGKAYAKSSIAQALATHFNVPVYGTYASVRFPKDKNGIRKPSVGRSYIFEDFEWFYPPKDPFDFVK